MTMTTMNLLLLKYLVLGSASQISKCIVKRVNNLNNICSVAMKLSLLFIMIFIIIYY